MAQETQTGLCINLEVGMGSEMGGRFKREGRYIYIYIYTHTYGWFMLWFDRKQQNSVKKLSFNKKIKKILKKDWPKQNLQIK